MRLIDADALLQQVSKNLDVAKLYLPVDFQEEITEAQTVDAVPVVHGRWVEETDRAMHWHCSNCKAVWGISHYQMKYCPGCGALMQER